MKGMHAFAPTWIAEYDLAEPGRAPAPPPGGRHVDARVLVRLHGHPLGYIQIPVADDRLEEVEAVARGAFGAEVRRHLAGDGLGDSDLHLDRSRWPGLPCSAALLRTTDAPPRISVVVCTRARADQLRFCLASVLRQSIPANEVVVVDGGVTGETERLLADLADERLRYVREPVAGLSRARNTGMRLAMGEVVVFTDDDVRADEHWLAWLVSALRRAPRVGLATGLVPSAELESHAQAMLDLRVSWGSGFESRLYDVGENHPGTPFFPYSAGVFGTGANFALTRAAIADVGEFDEALGASSPSAGGEELDMFLRVIKRGWTIAYEPAAVVWHYGQREMDIVHQMRSYGRGLGAYAFKHITRGGGGDMARHVPSALARLVTERRASAEGRRMPLRLRVAELVGLAQGPCGYVRGLRRVRAIRSGPPALPRS